MAQMLQKQSRLLGVKYSLEKGIIMRTEVALGVDIGGTNTAFGYVDRKGRCLASDSIPTNAHQPAELFFGRLHKSTTALLDSIQEKCELIGIGIGAPMQITTTER